MYNSNSSSARAENDRTDSWSFSFDYQRFSTKNKPKSLLGRRANPQLIPQKNDENVKKDEKTTPISPAFSELTPFKFQQLNEPSSLTHPARTPHKFHQPSLDSRFVFSKQDINKEKSCHRGLGFSTPFRHGEFKPLRDISSSFDQIKSIDSKTIPQKTNVNQVKDVVKDLSSIFVSNSINKDLNKSFIYEENYPLPGDVSILNDCENQLKSCSIDQATDSSHTDVNNSCFMTAHEIHPPDLSSFSRGNDFVYKTPGKFQNTFYLNTPGRNFTLFSVSHSPVNPLDGILNCDNDSINSDHSPCSNSVNKNVDSNYKNHSEEVNVLTPTVKSCDIISEEILESNKKNDEEILICEDKKYPQKENDDGKLITVKSSEPVLSSKPIHNTVSDKLNPISILNENRPVSTNKLQENVVHSTKYEPNTKLDNNCTPSSSIIKDHPTVISKNQPKNKENDVYSMKNNPSIHVQANPFVNSRLLVKQQPQNVLYVNNKPYTALSLLGRGGSSEVYQVLEENSSRLLAIKCVNLATADEGTAIGYLNEIELLSKLQGCSSVIKMFDHEYMESTKMLYVVMEKGDVDLSKLLKDITKIKKIPLSMVIYYWTEMLAAVKDIHDKGIIHSDLKPGNFLLVSGRLKLIDFGIASSLQEDMTSVEKDVIRGTFNYISPEAVHPGENRFHKINYKSDVWSLGCILYNLLFGCTPFSHITSTLGKFQALADPNFKIKLPKESSHVPPALKLSLRWCLIKDAKLRPTVDRLLKLSDHAIRVPQIDSLWYKCVIKEFPDCCVSFEELGN